MADSMEEEFSLCGYEGLYTLENRFIHFLSTGKSGATMSQMNGLTVFLYSMGNDVSLLYL